MTAGELAEKSTIVVVAVVRSVSPIGPVQRIRGLPLQLQRVEVDTEDIVKGTVPSTQFAFLYYAWRGEALPGGDLSPDFVFPGQRSAFFLEEVEGRLRSTVDVTQSRIGIASGRHRDSKLAAGTIPVRERLARILLTPGEGVDPREFAASLPNAISQAADMVGEAASARLLQPLVGHETDLIGVWACLELAARFFGQNQCLLSLVKDPRLTGDLRRQAERRLKASQDREIGLRTAFPNSPRDWLAHHAKSQQPTDIRDLLTLLAMHSDASLRRVACKVLTENFPSYSDAGCGQTK